MTNLNEKLIAVQSELKAPKGNFNKFGGYKYRSCEDILEAVKPLLAQNSLLLTIKDTIEEIGGRVYVRATATISDGDSAISVDAYAREAEVKKGMDDSQITGTASSYARKYCLNGLFLIDDTKDADTDEFTAQTRRQQTSRQPAQDFDGSARIDATQAKVIEDLAALAGKDVAAMCEYYKIKSCAELTVEQAATLKARLQKKIDADKKKAQKEITA